MWERSRDYAEFYRRAGIEPGQVVIVMLRHSPDLYASFVGAILCGAVPSFMPYPTPKQDVALFWAGHRTLFARIVPSAVVSYDEIADRLQESLPSQTLLLRHEDVRSFAHRIAPRTAGPDEVAFLQHSSGTTGSKKGVMLTHRALMAQVESYGRAIGFDRSSVIASWLPLYHDMGLIACFLLPLVVGATICQLDPIEWVGAPNSLLDIVERHGAGFTWLPNFAFDHLAFAARRSGKTWDLSTWRAVINCSEPCKPASMENLAGALATSSFDPDVPQICYAMAETVFAVTQTKVHEPIPMLQASKAGMTAHRFAAPIDDDDTIRLASCGTPISGATVEIVSADGDILSDGQVGEIRISGPSLYDGYHKLPTVTAAKFKSGWHHTGDLGFLWQGELYVSGRTDDLIIVRGRNFYAHDIENIVNSVSGVKPGRCVVFALDNARTGTSDAVCMVELTGDVEADLVKRDIKTQVEQASGLMLARVVAMPLASLIKTTSGKISREMNKVRYVESGNGVKTA